MANTIVANSLDIDATRGKIEGFKAEYHAHWDNVMSLKNQISETWSGVDNAKFAEQVEGFRNDFTELESKLDDYITFLKTAKTKYDTAQEQLKNSAAKLAKDR